MAAKYTVNLWGSKPGANDDCHTGDDFDTREEALAIYLTPAAHFRPVDVASTGWVEIDGPGIHDERCINPRRKVRDALEDWRREIAMQAGMGLGIEAYNDEMGF